MRGTRDKPAAPSATAPLDLSSLAEVRHEPAPASEVALARWIAGTLQPEAELPAFPALAARIFEVLEHPEPDTRELVRLIGQDPLVSAQVLKLANGAFHAGLSPVTTVRDAVVRLGHKQVASVAAALSTRAIFDLESRAYADLFAPDLQRLWAHALTTALAASFLADRRKLRLDHLFLGGLLFDVGKTAALRGLAALATSGKLGFTPSSRVVAAVLDAANERLGGQLATAWSFPGPVREIVQRAPTNAMHAVRAAAGVDAARFDPHPRLEETLQSFAALALTPAEQRALATEVRNAAGRAGGLTAS